MRRRRLHLVESKASSWPGSLMQSTEHGGVHAVNTLTEVLRRAEADPDGLGLVLGDAHAREGTAGDRCDDNTYLTGQAPATSVGKDDAHVSRR